jgi:hypothetical protein
MAKFVVYEKVAETVWRNFDKSTASPALATTVNLGSGLIAGFAAAIVSQPADTMLSKINKTKGLPGESTTSRLIKIAKELGFAGSYAGIGARLFMVGTLVRTLLCISTRKKLIQIRRLVNLLSTVTSSAFLVLLVELRFQIRTLLTRFVFLYLESVEFFILALYSFIHVAFSVTQVTPINAN